MTRVAVLGLGAMGSRIAARLHDAGDDVVVWNRSRRAIDAFVDVRPVTVAATPRDAARGADVVISIVTDDIASTSVWLDPASGALDAVGDGVAVEMSTITPHHAAHLALEAAQRRVRVLEAPVVGSRPQVEAGALVVLVGGDVGHLGRVRPTFDEIAGAVHHIGSVGDAATAKLAINGLFAAQVASFAETFDLLARSGVDTATVRRVVSGLAITSPAMQRVLGLFEAADFSPNFPIRLVDKDLDYLGRAAVAVGADLTINAAVAALFARAARGEAAELDISGVVTTLAA